MFLCMSGHIMQLLQRSFHKLTSPWVGKLDFSMQIMQFLGKVFWNLIPSPMTIGWKIGKHVFFLCISGHIIQFIVKIFLKLTHHPSSIPRGVEFGKHDFSVQLWTFYTVPRKKNFFRKYPMPTPMVAGLYEPNT